MATFFRTIYMGYNETYERTPSVRKSMTTNKNLVKYPARIEEDVFARLKSEAAFRGISVNNLLNLVLDKHLPKLEGIRVMDGDSFI